ncbi:DUF2306 domain-containing protein [Amycolatopsis sp. SID8362]|uniref:DUF2306 domain-containing protein n=1 Tax=Amycolatopsis sp. SID8362 TaxID=2690346 RepID=UPI00136920B2|nr:DUF2306 domain-containing protein [Amycolatopsis sp. SID8362]NBH07709.1 DUF2306 domain-containing protein [Amycolatopsis sp. SID8362]NED44405.1 DUF2306 domain-containing protein [Amycolatopsis sp. SID8362]
MTTTETAASIGEVRRATPWWRRPWVFPLGLLVTVFLVYSLPPYLGLNPAESRIPAPTAWYYPVLVTHIGFATIAMVTCALQIWPWLRQKHPVVHRRTGRVYVFAGAIPASVAGFAIALAAPFGPVGAVSNVLLATLWFTCTVQGYRTARARRFGEHRRWMVRSFALCMSIISNRVWAIVWATVLPGQLDTTFGGSELAMGQAIAGLTTWTGWVLPLLAAEWWLTRSRGRRRAPSPA